MQAEIQEINEGELVYLSPLTLVSVKAHSAKGKFGVYQDGYSIVFTLENGSTQVSIIAKKRADWFAQLNATRIKNPAVKKFSFEKNEMEGDRIVVSGVLA